MVIKKIKKHRYKSETLSGLKPNRIGSIGGVSRGSWALKPPTPIYFCLLPPYTKVCRNSSTSCESYAP